MNSYEKITARLSETKSVLKAEYAGCADVVFREIVSGDAGHTEALLVYIDGLCDKELLSDELLDRLLASSFALPGNIKRTVDMEFAPKYMNVPEVEIQETFEEAELCVFSGDAALFIDGCRGFVKVSARKFKSRGISDAQSKSVIRGPRDSFTESFQDNAVMIRRRYKNSRLKIEKLTIGRQTNTTVGICYLSGRCDEKMLEQVRTELSQIEMDTLIGIGQLQNKFCGNMNMTFAQVESTERPDDVCFALSGGRIVIIADNAPFALIIPALLCSMLTSSEEQFTEHFKRDILLYVRIFAGVVTLLLPAVYIAFVQFNPDFAAEKLMLMITQTRKYVTFPPFLEILFMQMVFEVIVEAAMRLPKQISSTVGIVGSLVIGQAIVDANLVNIMVVIIVAINALLAFLIPDFSLVSTLRFLRIIFMAVSALTGFFGMCLILLALLLNLCELSTLGVEFLYPFADCFECPVSADISPEPKEG